MSTTERDALIADTQREQAMRDLVEMTGHTRYHLYQWLLASPFTPEQTRELIRMLDERMEAA